MRSENIQEISGLDDVFDFLDEWPASKRDVGYERILKAIRDAACKPSSASFARESFQDFLTHHGKLRSRLLEWCSSAC
ncbi:DUF982 domain-containing protein [Rhizobium sp. YTU87027]|uniref:DUF982 domain-containing protein n=1 Tax=Rhizobium sp. YTU87027 TaxID=3417741 RepID=UPI003D682FFB